MYPLAFNMSALFQRRNLFQDYITYLRQHVGENEKERVTCKSKYGGFALLVQSNKGETTELDAVNIMFYLK